MLNVISILTWIEVSCCCSVFFLSVFHISSLFLSSFNLHTRFFLVLGNYLLCLDSALFRIFIILRSYVMGVAILIVALFFFTRGKGFNLPWKLLLTFCADLSNVVSCRLFRYRETIFILRIVLLARSTIFLTQVAPMYRPLYRKTVFQIISNLLNWHLLPLQAMGTIFTRPRHIKFLLGFFDRIRIFQLAYFPVRYVLYCCLGTLFFFTLAY